MKPGVADETSLVARGWRPLLAALLLRLMLPAAAVLFGGATADIALPGLGDVGIWSRFITPDTNSYLTPARHLLEHGAFTNRSGPEIFRTPGYSVVLTLGLIAGHPILLTLLLQALAGTFTVWCIMRTAALVFADGEPAAPRGGGSGSTSPARASTGCVSTAANARVVNACGWLAACEPLALLCGALMMADTMLTTAIGAVALLVVMYIRKPSTRTAIALGAALAAAAYIKPIAYYLPAALIPWLWLRQRGSQSAAPRSDLAPWSGAGRGSSTKLTGAAPSAPAVSAPTRADMPATNRARRSPSSSSLDLESPYQGNPSHSPPLLWERGPGGVGTGSMLAMAATVAILCGAWQVRNGIQTGFWGFSTLTARAVYVAAGGGVTAARDGRPFGEVRKERLEQAAIPTPRESLHIGDMYRRGLGDVLGSPDLAVAVHVRGMLLTLFDPGSLDYLRLFGVYPATSPVTRFGGQGLVATAATIARAYPAVLWCSLLLETILLAYVALAARGAWRALRPGVPEARGLLLIAAYFLFLAGGIFGTARFRLPIMPVMVLLGAYALRAEPPHPNPFPASGARE